MRTLRTREAPGWDPAEYVEERVWVLARDGATRIPVTLIHHRDARPDGTHAGWQIGYGSYEVSYDPEFETLRLPILRRVVYAIAHVRGGGEMGRAWYEDGLIDGAVIITKDRVPLLDLACSLWADHKGVDSADVYAATRCPKKKRDDRQKELALPLDLTTTTVTSLDQAQPRVDRGEAGTCPVAVIAVSDRTWDRTPYGSATPVVS